MSKLSIVIPVYNEIKTLDTILDQVLSLEIDKEIIIVDDFSTDGSREKLKDYEDRFPFRVFYHEKNRGKGAALRTGFGNVTGDIVAIQDADLEYDPQELLMLIKPIVNKHADVVYGSRFITTKERRVHLFWHSIVNKGITLLSNMFTNLNLTDIETCYKVFKTEIISQVTIEEDRFGFEPEITAKISKIKKIKIYEIGISYRGRDYDEGKKIGMKDGFRALYAIVKYNLF